MTIPKLPAALSVLLLLSSDVSADSAPKQAVPEFCGKIASPSLAYEFLHWDCSGIVSSTIADLELLVQKTHSIPSALDASTYKVYESADPHFSAWIFTADKAVRYRQIFDGEQYKGIGVTTFCVATQDICTRFEAFSASSIPGPLMFKLGPPAPEQPPILY